MKILFISHSYPPIVGGVESQNFELYTWLSKTADVRLLANRKRWLIPIFFGYAAFRALFTARNYDVVLLGSCILSPIGWLVKKFTRTPAISVAHGLDLTWNNPIYQKLWPGFFVPSLDRLIAVGNETIKVGTERGIPKEKFIFIPNGVDTEKFLRPHTREELEKVVGEKLLGKKILLTTGRLAVHKGMDWFVDKVMPKMGENVLYLIAGDGEKRKDIEKAIQKNKLENKVKMLGYVSDADREVLYNTADVYVKPNIKVEGTMEGFGIVVVEAASCKLPVVASDLEGLKDAIKDGESGVLVEPYDADGFSREIDKFFEDENYRIAFGEKARKYVVENFAWEKIARRYLEEISRIIRKK